MGAEPYVHRWISLLTASQMLGWLVSADAYQVITHKLTLSVTLTLSVHDNYLDPLQCRYESSGSRQGNLPTLQIPLPAFRSVVCAHHEQYYSHH